MQTIQGKIVKFLPKIEGDSTSGKHWVKGGLVIEYDDGYPTKAVFTAFGEQRLQQINSFSVGMDIAVNYNPQSREYNDHWYTDLQYISAFQIQQATQQPAAQPAPQQQQQQQQQAQYPYAQQHVQQQQAQMPASMPADQDLPF